MQFGSISSQPTFSMGVNSPLRPRLGLPGAGFPPFSQPSVSLPQAWADEFTLLLLLLVEQLNRLGASAPPAFSNLTGIDPALASFAPERPTSQTAAPTTITPFQVGTSSPDPNDNRYGEALGGGVRMLFHTKQGVESSVGSTVSDAMGSLTPTSEDVGVFNIHDYASTFNGFLEGARVYHTVSKTESDSIVQSNAILVTTGRQDSATAKVDAGIYTAQQAKEYAKQYDAPPPGSHLSVTTDGNVLIAKGNRPPTPVPAGTYSKEDAAAYLQAHNGPPAGAKISIDSKSGSVTVNY